MEIKLIVILLILFILESLAYGVAFKKIFKRKSALDYSFFKESIGFIIVSFWFSGGIIDENYFLLLGCLFDLIPRTILLTLIIFYGEINVNTIKYYFRRFKKIESH